MQIFIKAIRRDTRYLFSSYMATKKKLVDIKDLSLTCQVSCEKEATTV